MTVIKKSVTIPYTSAQMYELANGIEQYPEFLSWCKAAIVQSRDQRKIQATIRGHKMGIDFAFSIVNYLQQNKLITINLVHRGPFKQIEGYFKFEALNEKSSLFTFELQFEFINRFLGWTLTPIIKSESSNLINDFCKRAKKIYE